MMPMISPVAPRGVGSIDFERDDSDSIATTTNIGAIGTGAFTWEAWVKPESFPAGASTIMGIDNGDLNYFRVTNTTTINVSVGGTTWAVTVPTMSSGTWYHIAVCRSGTTAYTFFGGTLEDSSTRGGSIADGTAILGTRDDATATDVFDGKIAYARWSDIARYTSSFTPATSYGTDANTMALIGAYPSGLSLAITEKTGLTLTTVDGSPVVSSDRPS